MKHITTLTLISLIELICFHDSHAWHVLPRQQLRKKPDKVKNCRVWPDCDAVVHCLQPLVVSGIVGGISKKLLQVCGDAELPQLDKWAPTIYEKLDKGKKLSEVIDWLLLEIKKLSGGITNTAKPTKTTVGAGSGLDKGPSYPSSCYDYGAYLQIVDDEKGIDDDDWS